jgi:hypothetical protein
MESSLIRDGTREEAVETEAEIKEDTDKPAGRPTESAGRPTATTGQKPPETDMALTGTALTNTDRVDTESNERALNEPDSAAPPGEGKKGLILKAIVRERTWLKVAVDDNDPKEYIFPPGSMPQWEAERGFDLVIGNATGIEFELNGEPYQNLGRRGQVVRLRLPGDFSPNRPEE